MNADDPRRDADETTESPDPHAPDPRDTDPHASDPHAADTEWIDLDDDGRPADEFDRDDLTGELDRDEPADDFAADDAPAAARSRNWTQSLLGNPVRLVLAAVVIGALVAGGIAVATGLFDDSGEVGGTNIGEGERLAENAFTRSAPGDCLDWPAGDPGNPTKVPCEGKHRFEVAGKVDTGLIPGSEFGSNAPWPGPERFAAIRQEQCPVVVDGYLDARLDPVGRFSVQLMFPSQVQWDKGARALRCGLQQTGADGAPVQFSGRVADQNQSFVWPEGTCIGIDAATRKPTGFPVNCAEPHAFQTTGTVDLAVRFGDRLSGKPWPATGKQNSYLASICPGQADRYIGKDKLDASTLNVQWSVLGEASWLAGSRKVVCYLGLPDKRGGFATLVGNARDGVLLINGKAPIPPPQAPPGRALPTPVPLPPGVAPNPQEVPAPAG